MKTYVFEKGRHYRVKRNFTSGGSDFTAGEMLTNDGEGFSPYDNCFIAAFVSHTNNQRKDWFGAPEDKDLWGEYLEPMNE